MNDFTLIKVDVGKISDVAIKLVDKISDAVGVVAQPWQIERIARAEAKADFIRANTRIQISELEERALQRMVREEAQKQENIESITAKAIPHLSEEAQPDALERDWLTHFFDRCRLVSDEEMQAIWSSLLAKEANEPGSFSKRTIDLVATLDKSDAELFTSLCTFVWTIDGPTALIFDIESDIYAKEGINYPSITHLDSMGLISFAIMGVGATMSGSTTAYYHRRPIFIEIPENATVDLGQVMLTRAGEQLARICNSVPSEIYLEHVMSNWLKSGYSISTDINARELWKAKKR